jgi:hypothetical protein
MIYELRWRDGRIHQLAADETLTDEVEADLLDGSAQLVCIDDAGSIDLEGITAMVAFGTAAPGGSEAPQQLDGRETSMVAVAGDPPETFNAIPLRTIRVLRSVGSAAWRSGQHFESVADFDVVIAAVRADQPLGERHPSIAVSFALEWADGTTHESSLNPFVETMAEHLRRLLMIVLSKVVAVATAAARHDGDEGP